MSADFPIFAAAVKKRFDIMSQGEILVVDSPDIFDVYLASFPEGSNPIFRTRTEHDCSTDKHFVRNLGRTVQIRAGAIHTIWDIPTALPHPYNAVAKAMSDYVRSLALAGVFRTKERRYGKERSVTMIADPRLVADYADNFPGVAAPKQVPHTFFHFHAEVAAKHYSKTPGEARGAIDTTVQVFQRGLDELSVAACKTVLDLIDANALYRGAEFRKAVAEFLSMLEGYRTLNSDTARSIFAWQNFDSPAARFRNTAIGTLVIDLSAGVDLERAVKSFESKVAPHNYKRTTALVTQGMINKALATIADLGLESALERRYARFSDLSVNDVLFVDNAARPLMKQGLAGLLKPTAPVMQTVDPKLFVAIGVDEFLRDVVPKASSLQLYVENKHAGNYVSLTAPVHADAGRLFKWDNGFAWSYDGEVADSMRERVQARGGRVDGVLRFTHQWNDVGRNASLMDLHVFMPGHEFTRNPSGDRLVNDAYGNRERVGWNNRRHFSTQGVQDVDHVEAAPAGFIPVENITFPDLRRMPEGDYVMKVHNWQLRSPTDSGFKAEIEFEGQVFQYDHPQKLGNKEWITLAVVTLRAGKFSIRHVHPSTTSSVERWGIASQNFVPVETLLASPNHWHNENGIGNKHWFFVLKSCRNPGETRGIYNEFLDSRLEPHRKVFELIGSKTKCPASDEQLSGLGFSSTRQDKAILMVQSDTSRRVYEVAF